MTQQFCAVVRERGMLMPEIWDLYTMEKKKTGRTWARGAPLPEGFYHLVVSVWIVNSRGQYLLSQRHPKKQYPFAWECTGGCVLAGESSLAGALREVKEELGITLDPADAKILRQIRREAVQDFYDVWRFYADIPIEKVALQKNEVINVRWADRSTLLEMYRGGMLHPLLDYIEQLE